MSLILLIPGLISLYLVLRGRAETAFLSVYLPALLLLPNGYAMRIPHMPLISAAQFALLPILPTAFARYFKQGRFQLMDLLVAGFVASAAVSEVKRELIPKDGMMIAIDMFISIFCVYIVGKTMIEPSGIRFETSRRIVWLMLLMLPMGLAEWRLGQDFYGVFAERVLHIFTVPSYLQIRGGHGRLNVSFSDAEIAGIALAMTTMLAVWLFYLRRWNVLPASRKLLARAERMHVPEFLLLLALFLTQSRGPMLGVMVGYVVALVPRFRKTRPMAILAYTMILVMVVAIVAYFFAYTRAATSGDITEQQGSALYRLKLNQIYEPVVNAGGLLGWGQLSKPDLQGMKSIDNEYLLVHLSFGHLGYWMFLLAAIESVRQVLWTAWKNAPREDQSFAYIMGAALLLAWLTLTTVYMGEQLPQFIFLLAGWGQALGKYPMVEYAYETEPQRMFTFTRVFQ